MPRQARDNRLDTRTARLTLKPRREPYWKAVQAGRAIGYRRVTGGRAGAWIAKHINPDGGRKLRSIGLADDALLADGVATLTWAQAQERARAWWREIDRAAVPVVEAVRVRDAMTAYVADYRARGGKSEHLMQTVIDAHILPTFGAHQVEQLTSMALTKWHHAIAAAPVRLRTRPNEAQKFGKERDEASAQRARRSTANRILTVLKAALSHAFRQGRVASDVAWRRVAPFQKVDAAKVRYLLDDEAVRLVNACPSDLRALVSAALVTGCRYGELAALIVDDFDPDAAVVHIRDGKTGARIVFLTADGRRFFEQVTAGKARGAPILTRDDGTTWGKSYAIRPLKAACAAAKISPAISFHILRHSFASRLAMKAVSMSVIAAALGNLEAICAKHYAHLSPGYIADTIRQHAGGLDIVPADQVAPIRPAASAVAHADGSTPRGEVVPFRKRGVVA